MRVVLFTREYPPDVYGGAGVHVSYLSRELSKTADVEVQCWGTQHEDHGRLHIRGQEPWSEISQGVTGRFKTSLEALSLNLTQVKHLEDVDLAHTHTWYAAMAGLLAKKLYNIPFVMTSHSLEPLRAWKAEQLGRGYSVSSWIEKAAIDEADAIIAVSHGAEQDLLRCYPEAKGRTRVIYNGIDPTEFTSTTETAALEKFGIDLHSPYILFIGRVTRQKGVTHLMDAARHLPREVQLVLCAAAPDTAEIAQELRLKVEDARQTRPVIWIEQMLGNREKIQLLSHAGVFCCPSIYEPFGITNLEAMACSIPVVASAVGGITEIVEEGKTGYLVPFDREPVTGYPCNPDRFARDLADKIRELLNSPEKCRRFGEAGRKRAVDKFSWNSIAVQTIDLYRELIERPKAAIGR